MHTGFTLILCGIALCGRAGAEQTPLTDVHTDNPGATRVSDPVFNHALRARIGEIVKNQNVTGHSVGLLRLAHSIAFNGSDGVNEDLTEFAQWGNRTETGDPVTQDTIIGLGSTSKAFASAAVGLIIHDFATRQNVTALPLGLDEFTWDTKIMDLLPEDWKLMDKWASEKASVRDVLSHVSGMPRHDFAYYRNDTALAAIRRMRYLRPAYELRQEWHYNNFGYMLAQVLIERFSNQTLPEFIGERIFKPLNMTSTSYSLSAALASGRASQAFDAAYRRIPLGLPDIDQALIAGAGGILSTAPDMLKWAKLLLGGWKDKEEDEIVPAKVREECMGAQTLLPRATKGKFGSGRVTYGFGWFQDEVSGVRRVYHGGNVEGATALLTLLSDHGVAVVQLVNSDQKSQATDLVLGQIMRAMRILPDDHERDGLVFPEEDKIRGSALTPRADDRAVLEKINLAEFAGTYRDPGYGGYIFCPPPAGTSLGSMTSRCKEVFDAYSSLENITALSHKKLYGYMVRPSVWADYLTLNLLSNSDDSVTVPARSEDNEKNVTFELHYTRVFPEGYGADKSPYEYDLTKSAGIRAVFPYEDDKVVGFGVFGLAGGVLEREKRGGSVQERAEAWFVKD